MYLYRILLSLPEYIPFSILFQFSPRPLLYPLNLVSAAHVHMGVGFPSLGQGNLLCPTLLRKTHSFSFRGHQLPIIPQLQVELPESLLLPYWVGPACPMQGSCAGKHKCCEFMCAAALSYPEDMTSKQSFLPCGFYSLSGASSTKTPGPWGWKNLAWSHSLFST